MPAPPPYGVSSTVRCRSWVQVRRSWTCSSTSPLVVRLPGQRQPSGVEVLGEDRDEVERSRLGPSSNGVTRPGRSATTIRPAARSTSGTSAVTNGTSASRPSGVRMVSRSWAAPWIRPGDRAQRRAVDVVRRQPDQLVVVELLGVLRRRVGRDARVQHDAAGPLGGGRGRAAPRTPASQRPLVPAGAGHGERPERARRAPGRLGPQRGADGEAALGLVGAHVDGHLAAQPVRPADPADDDLDPAVAGAGRRERISAAGRRPRSRSARRPARRGPR